jgi:hypothetical protein
LRSVGIVYLKGELTKSEPQAATAYYQPSPPHTIHFQRKLPAIPLGSARQSAFSL